MEALYSKLCLYIAFVEVCALKEQRATSSPGGWDLVEEKNATLWQRLQKPVATEPRSGLQEME